MSHCLLATNLPLYPPSVKAVGHSISYAVVVANHHYANTSVV